MKISSEIFHGMLLFGFNNSRHIKSINKPFYVFNKKHIDTKYFLKTDYPKKTNKSNSCEKNINYINPALCSKAYQFFNENHKLIFLIFVLIIIMNSTHVVAEENNLEEEIQKLIHHLEHEDELDSALYQYNLLKHHLSKQDDEKIKSKLISLILKRAYKRLENKNYSDAYDDFKRVIMLDDKHIESYYQIALILKQNDFLKAALDKFNYAFEIILEHETAQSKIEKSKRDTKATKKRLRKLKQQIQDNRIYLLEQMNELQLNIRGSSGQPTEISSDSIRKYKQIDTIMLKFVKDEDDASELRQAIQKGNEDNIKNLIEEGYNPAKPWINIREDKILIELPVEYAKSEKKWEIFSLLLEKTVYYSSTKNLKEIINGYAEHYVAYPDYDPRSSDKNKNLGIALLSTKQLLTYSVEYSIKDYNNLDAYRKHLEESTKSGMNTAVFLIFRSFLVINMLFKFKSGVFDMQLNALYKNTLDEHKKKIIEQALFEELHVTVDTFYSYRIAHYVNEISENKERNKKAYVSSQISKLLDSKEEHEYIYPGGYNLKKSGSMGHAVYVAFFKHKEQLRIRIDNLGDGCDRHNKITQDGKIHFYPCDLGLFNEKEAQEKYFFDLLEEGFIQENGKDSLAKIYRLPSICEKFETWNPQPGQVTENCVRENFNIGTRIRLNALLGDRFFYWFVAKEAELLAELSLPINDIVLNNQQSDNTLSK